MFPSFGIGIIVLLVLIVKNWSKIIAAWKKMWADFWLWLRGAKPSSELQEAAEAKAAEASFASFNNPFSSGMVEQASPAEVVRYTFSAVEAWARERGIGRDGEQTAYEFARKIADFDQALQLTSLSLIIQETLPHT